MAEKNTRKLQAQETKRRIFNTSVRLIKELGYSQVTVSRICEEAGIAKGSFYVHYQSKEDIIKESYYSDMEAYMERVLADYQLTHKDASITQKLIRFLCAELEFAEYAGHELTCLAYSLNLASCAGGHSDHMQRRRFTAELRGLIQRMESSLPDGFSTDDAFTYFESLVRGVMATWCFSPQEFNLSETGKQFLSQSVICFFTCSKF